MPFADLKETEPTDIVLHLNSCFNTNSSKNTITNDKTT